MTLRKKIVLRPEQKTAVEKGLEYFNSTKKQRPAIMVEPVAFGKSLVISKIASQLEYPTLVLQPSIELLQQNYQKLLWFGGNAKIYSASANSKEIGHLTYATLGSIKKLGKHFKELNFKNVIIDECDRSYSPKTGSMFRTFIKDLNPRSVLGFTATPIRLNTYGTIERTYSQLDFLMKGRKGAPAFFKDIIHLTQVSRMVEQGYWSKLHYELYDFDESLLTLNSTGAEYTQESISNAVATQGINNNIYLRVKHLLNTGQKKNILIFVDSVYTAKTLAEVLPDTAYVTGDMDKKERQRVIENFKNGHIRCVANFGTLVAGFDHPELDTVILGRPTNSFALFYQMVGRGTRIHPDKENTLVVDFCNNVKRFGKLETIEYEYIDGYGWGLFNNDKLLSNYPMDLPPKHKQDIYNEVKEKLKEYDNQNKYGTKLWFGKYKGKYLNEVPVYYLKYIVTSFDPDKPKIKKLIEEIKKLLK